MPDQILGLKNLDPGQTGSGYKITFNALENLINIFRKLKLINLSNFTSFLKFGQLLLRAKMLGIFYVFMSHV